MTPILGKTVNYFVNESPRDFFEGAHTIAKALQFTALSPQGRAQAAQVSTVASQVWGGLVWISLLDATQKLIQSIPADFTSLDKVKECFKNTLGFVGNAFEALDHLHESLHLVDLGKNIPLIRTIALGAFLAGDMVEAGEVCVHAYQHPNKLTEAALKLAKIATSVALIVLALWSVCLGSPVFPVAVIVLTVLNLGLKIAVWDEPPSAGVPPGAVDRLAVLANGS